nr:phage tail protein I [uncultured Pseudomonas sp.]
MSELLPPNSTDLERRLAETGSAISDVPVPTRSVWDPNTAPAEQLPWLAWALSVDSWNPEWTEEQKRQTIRASSIVHRYKGTAAALKENLAALGFPIRVQEWYQQEPPGKPGTFRLVIDAQQTGVPDTAALRFMPVVLATKNLRSHLDLIELRALTKTHVYVGAQCLTGQEVTLRYADTQYVAFEPGFVEAETGLNQLTNVDLVQAMGLNNG